jgi:hypothetical protein
MNVIFLPAKILLELKPSKIRFPYLKLLFRSPSWNFNFNLRKYRRVCCYSITGREEVMILILSHVKCLKCFCPMFDHDFIVSITSTSLLSRAVCPFVDPQELCDSQAKQSRAVDGVSVTCCKSTSLLPSELHTVWATTCTTFVALRKVVLSTWFQHCTHFHTFLATAIITKNTTYPL